jgi:putative transposase
MERDILKSRLFRQAPSVVFAWIDAEKAEFPIAKLCQYLQVSPGGFYAACGRPESAHAQTDRRLLRAGLVRREPAAVWQPAHSRGSNRAAGARQSETHHPSDAGRRLEARARKRFKCTTMSDRDQPVAGNLLDRRFQAPGPNQRWVGDTTEFVIGGSGKLYLAAVLDLFSRFVVGLVRSALRCPICGSRWSAP